MTVQPFLVADYKTGLETDMEPWLLPEEAVSEINDAYVWRKRIKRRGGNKFLGRLSQEAVQTYPLAVTNSATSFTNTNPTPPPVIEPIENLPIRPFSVVVTINAYTFADDGMGNMVSTQGFLPNGTINYFTGIFNVNFTAITSGGPYNVTVQYNFYPNLPAMGLLTKENFQITVQDLIGFNTTKANIWDSATNYFDDISFYDESEQPINWTGADYNFFDAENYQNAFFASNNTPGYHYQNITTITFTPGSPGSFTVTFSNNVLLAGDSVFFFNVASSAPTTSTSYAMLLNGETFIIASSTATTITFAEATAPTDTYTAGTGTVSLLQQSGYDVAQAITGITSMSTTDTKITFSSNTLVAGNNVYIEFITGNMGAVLNGLSFTVTSADTTTIHINVNTTGLTYTSGGLVTRPIGDGIRWYANDPNVNGWVNFNPPLNGVSVLTGCRLMVGYKDRLVLLNTFEGTIGQSGSANYANRARWSQNGTCFYSTPVPVDQSADPESWRDDIPGRGGYIDAPTTEEILGCEFIRDTLVVFFERSTWALRYTTNEALPFVWVRINVEFGSLCQQSTVPFDRGILAIGNRGIITADGNNVERIDLKIPDTVFNFEISDNNNARIQGIRDYFNELVYWTYIDDSYPLINYPNKILVYNYREGSFSIFNDSYTCFGYFTQGLAYLWNTADVKWNEANFTWNSPQISGNFPSVVAGTNTGYVMVLPAEEDPDISNDTQISIAGITQGTTPIVTTNFNHNLSNTQYGDKSNWQYVSFANVQGMTQINGLVSHINVLTETTFELLDINTSSFSAYTYGGDIIRVNNFSIWTKQFNPFVPNALGVFMNRLDIYSDFVEGGQISIYVYVNGDTTTPINVAQSGAPQFYQFLFELDQSPYALEVDKTWARCNAHIRGQFVQLEFTLNDIQMLDSDINASPFVLHAFILWMGKSGRIISR